MTARERVIAWWHAITRTSHTEDGEVATLTGDAERDTRPATKAA